MLWDWRNRGALYRYLQYISSLWAYFRSSTRRASRHCVLWSDCFKHWLDHGTFYYLSGRKSKSSYSEKLSTCLWLLLVEVPDSLSSLSQRVRNPIAGPPLHYLLVVCELLCVEKCSITRFWYSRKPHVKQGDFLLQWAEEVLWVNRATCGLERLSDIESLGVILSFSSFICWPNWMYLTNGKQNAKCCLWEILIKFWQLPIYIYFKSCSETNRPLFKIH